MRKRLLRIHLGESGPKSGKTTVQSSDPIKASAHPSWVTDLGPEGNHHDADGLDDSDGPTQQLGSNLHLADRKGVAGALPEEGIQS